uniref:BHLH domain-containing protein n=1 Tax=Trichuris muris TaxID=70415 RepID=A0A5S6QYY1_TRIMR
MVAAVAIPFESLPVKRRKLQADQKRRTQQAHASPLSSDDEEIVVTVEEEEQNGGQAPSPSGDEVPLDLSSKKRSSSTLRAAVPTVNTTTTLLQHPSALMSPAVPLFFSFYPAWNTLPYFYTAAPFVGAVLGPAGALNACQLPAAVRSPPDVSPKPSSLSSASPSSSSSPSSSLSSLPSSPPSSSADSTTTSAATKHRRARNPVVRRMVANARERCRVHMIGEAFEALRVALPSACPAQKLTKVSILRIACDYIMLLGAMNGRDYSADQRAPTVDQLRRQLSETILAETNFRCV